MHEHIFPTIIRRDESEALHTVEPLHLRSEAKRRLVNCDEKKLARGDEISKRSLGRGNASPRRRRRRRRVAVDTTRAHKYSIHTIAAPCAARVRRRRVFGTKPPGVSKRDDPMPDALRRASTRSRASTRLRPALARDNVQEKFTHRPRRPRGVERHRATPARRATARDGATVRS